MLYELAWPCLALVVEGASGLAISVLFGTNGLRSQLCHLVRHQFPVLFRWICCPRDLVVMVMGGYNPVSAYLQQPKGTEMRV